MKKWNELVEILDTKVRLDVTENSSYRFSAFFQIAGGKTGSGFEFQFSATKVGEDHDGDEWDVVFMRVFSMPNPGRSPIEAFNDMTTKEVLTTFSGVKTALMKWYKSQKPDSFNFVAKSSEGSRVKLYNRLAKQIAKKLNLNLATGTVGSNEKYVFSQKVKFHG